MGLIQGLQRPCVWDVQAVTLFPLLIFNFYHIFIFTLRVWFFSNRFSAIDSHLKHIIPAFISSKRNPIISTGNFHRLIFYNYWLIYFFLFCYISISFLNLFLMFWFLCENCFIFFVIRLSKIWKYFSIQFYFLEFIYNSLTVFKYLVHYSHSLSFFNFCSWKLQCPLISTGIYGLTAGFSWNIYIHLSLAQAF
jgi:hypothetical protein